MASEPEMFKIEPEMFKIEPEITITTAEATTKSSLIVVSNRLPFVLKKNAEGKMMRQAR